VRLWSIHPAYLDTKGLVALWREGLLARAVLRGATRGYRSHPQLERFRACRAAVSTINDYLGGVVAEADRRGFRFDRSKLGPVRHRTRIRVSSGQLAFELSHLSAKLEVRDPAAWAALPAPSEVRAHPLFEVVPGAIASWERGVK
jgi:hypothetical protein